MLSFDSKNEEKGLIKKDIRIDFMFTKSSHRSLLVKAALIVTVECWTILDGLKFMLEIWEDRLKLPFGRVYVFVVLVGSYRWISFSSSSSTTSFSATPSNTSASCRNTTFAF